MQIRCALCNKLVEKSFWFDDKKTGERVLKVVCHGDIDEMRIFLDNFSLEDLKSFENQIGVAFNKQQRLGHETKNLPGSSKGKGIGK